MPKMLKERPAFNESDLALLMSSVQNLFYRMREASVISLTHREIINLIAPAVQREVLLSAPVYSNTYPVGEYATIWWSGEKLEKETGSHGVSLQIHFIPDPITKYFPLMPKAPEIQPDANPELMNRIDDWVIERVKLGRNFEMVRTVLGGLNAFCTNPSQVKFFWPTISALAARKEELGRLSEKLAKSKVPTTIPAIPMWLKDQIRQTAGIVSSALLLPEDIDHTPTAVELECQADDNLLHPL